ncbi:MAG: cytochrome c [Fimbriiglobus sp.]|jgi:mono/diheme cytochrome c family protein|nr:cytochrome c [Fimbriiglobus sp.]
MPPTRLLLIVIIPLMVLLAAVATIPVFVGGGDNADTPAAHELKYAARTDPVVVALPPTHPADRHKVAEKLDEYITQLPTLGGVIARPDQLPDDQKTRLASVVESLFGKPAAPTVAGIDPATADRFALRPQDLASVVNHYRQSCSNCHGSTGNGRGVSGLYSFPHPRDFRSGKFKLATGAGVGTGRPRFADVMTAIKLGVPGTTMQATGLPDAQVRRLAGYTVFLSIRGEVEVELIKALADPDEAPSDIEAEAKKRLAAVLKKWTDADAEVPLTHAVQPRPEAVTPEYAESVRRGQKLFTSAQGACTSCHTNYGRTPTYRYDVWGVPNEVRNLTDKERHWARTPEDFVRQLKYGIAAAGMPAAPAGLNDQDLADLVHFVRELPFAERLPDDVRREVYPK